MKTWICGLCGLAVLAVAIGSATGAEITFKKTTIDPIFRAEGVAVADFSGDGRKDIATNHYKKIFRKKPANIPKNKRWWIMINYFGLTPAEEVHSLVCH